MIKLVILAFVFLPVLSYGEDVLRLADSFTSFKQGVLVSAGLSHFLSENQNCEIEGTVMIKPEENFPRQSDSVSFRVNPDSSFGSNPIPFRGGVHSYAGELEKSHKALISREELVKRGFHQNETDGEMAQYGHQIITEPVEGENWEALQIVNGKEDLDGSWQGAFSSGSLTGGKAVAVKGTEVKTLHEAYQALSQGESLYLMEPLGGGGGAGGSHLQIVGVLLPQGHYLESDELLQAEMIKGPIQESVIYGSVQGGSSVALPAVQCSQH